MRKSAEQSEPRRNHTLVAGGLILLLAAFLVWQFSASESQQADTKSSSNHQTSAKPPVDRQAKDLQTEDSAPVSKKRERRQSRSGEALALPTFTQVDTLLTDDRLSDEDAAIEMAKIALDATRPEAERLEAMEHGMNLGFGHLLSLSSDPNLPVPLAESYLHGLHGHDQIKEQVSGALGLLDHSDQEIRQEAGVLLGFLLEAEEDNESPDKLRMKADMFLNQPDEVEEEVSGQ